jgi:hypothetical protein
MLAGMSMLSPSSVVFVVMATTLAIVVLTLVASWLAGWYDERARRAEHAVHRGAHLRAGFGAIHGTAQRLGARGGGLLAVTETSQAYTTGRWHDVKEETTGSPFAIVVAGGEEIEVDPTDAVVEGGEPEGLAIGTTRRLLARVSGGDTVWATGILSGASASGTGAYRSGPSRRRIRAVRGGKVVIGRRSPVPRWRGLASAHRKGALSALGVGALVHAVAFRTVDAAIARGDTLCLQADNLCAPARCGGRGWAVDSGLPAVGVAAAVWWACVREARRKLGR